METSRKPHFVLVPWVGGVSHIVPMSDIGCLLASHGACVTIITTPASVSIVQSRVDRASRQGAVIAVSAIPFPAAEAGLPEGCERMELIPSPAMVPSFFKANKRFGEAVARYCRQQDAARRPSCVIAGTCHTWTLPMARDLGVPCYIFHGFGAFALLCVEHLYKQGRHEAIASADEPVDISVLPQPFECKILGRQLPLQFLPSMSVGSGLMQEIREFDVAVDGIVVNSFDELEHGSTALLEAAAGKRVVAVGPVSLCCGAPSLEPPRRDDDARRCMAWLDAKKAGSVVYVSFGSAGCIPPAQLLQLGMALVSCPWPVMWVLRGADSLPDDVKEWLRENTDADGKCLVVRGWAPQVAILEHPAVGGFMTHCGWGSTLESVAAGVPMVTWPLFAEQFVNEKLIVDVLGIGVSVGVTKPTENVLTAGKLGSGEAMAAEVGAEQVKRALERLMDGGSEGEEMRRKALELKEKANVALQEGGSSYSNLEKLIESSV